MSKRFSKCHLLAKLLDFNTAGFQRGKHFFKRVAQITGIGNLNFNHLVTAGKIRIEIDRTGNSQDYFFRLFGLPDAFVNHLELRVFRAAGYPVPAAVLSRR